MANADLSADSLRERLNYDSDTGIFRWKISAGSVKAGDEAGFTIGGGYRQIKVRQRFYLAHRLAWLYVHGRWPDGIIDHLNGVRADNRIANLREVTYSMNSENQRKARPSNRTGLLGVVETKSKTFRALIAVKGKRMHIGTASTAEEAHQMYLDAKRRMHKGNTL